MIVDFDLKCYGIIIIIIITELLSSKQCWTKNCLLWLKPQQQDFHLYDAMKTTTALSHGTALAAAFWL